MKKNSVIALFTVAVFFIGLFPNAAFAGTKNRSGRVLKRAEERIKKLSEVLAKNLREYSGDIQKVAVVKFTNLGPTAMENKVGEVVAEIVQFNFKKEGFTLVEREKIDAVLEELKLSMLGLTEGKNAKKVGQLLEAEAILTGSVNEIGGNFTIIARVIDVGTGKIIKAVKVSIPVDEMVKLSDKYVVKKTRVEALYRSFIPGWGQFYNGQAWKAYVILGLEAGAIGAAIYNELRARRVYNKFYKNATDPDEAVRLYDNAQKHRKIRDAFIYTAIGIWALGIIDAVISGPSGKKVELKKIEVAPVFGDHYYAIAIKGRF